MHLKITIVIWLKLLINNNADLKVTDSDGWTAYGLAATSGNYQTLDLLIKKGINPNTRNSSSSYSSYACM